MIFITSPWKSVTWFKSSVFQKNGENYVTRLSIVCTFDLIVLRWFNQGSWDGSGIGTIFQALGIELGDTHKLVSP